MSENEKQGKRAQHVSAAKRLRPSQDILDRVREPGDDDDVPAPPRFTVPPDQSTALLEHAVKKVLEELVASSDAKTSEKLLELQGKWEAENAK
jgi:hypothetical protein